MYDMATIFHFFDIIIYILHINNDVKEGIKIWKAAGVHLGQNNKLSYSRLRSSILGQSSLSASTATTVLTEHQVSVFLLDTHSQTHTIICRHSSNVSFSSFSIQTSTTLFKERGTKFQVILVFLYSLTDVVTINSQNTENDCIVSSKHVFVFRET